MSETLPLGEPVNVIELNRYAPRPFVFTDLALCLRDSIRAAGFASNVLVNESDPRFASIVLGATPALEPFVEGLDPNRTAVLNLEQLGSNSALAGPGYRRWLRERIVVDYHSSNVDYLKRENGDAQKVLELPLVPSPTIGHVREPIVAKTVDVLFFGTRNKRRLEIIRQLEAEGISVEVVAGAYGRELAPAILRARIVLHVHFYETALFPIVRVLRPVIHGAPIVCEASAFSAHSDWSDSGIRFAGYESLVGACRDLLRSPEEQLRRARRALQFPTQIDFRTPFNLLAQYLGLEYGPDAR